MGFNGGRGDEQLFSDFLVGMAQAGHGSDLFFSRRESLPGFQVLGSFLAVLEGKAQHLLPHFIERLFLFLGQAREGQAERLIQFDKLGRLKEVFDGV